MKSLPADLPKVVVMSGHLLFPCERSKNKRGVWVAHTIGRGRPKKKKLKMSSTEERRKRMLFRSSAKATPPESLRLALFGDRTVPVSIQTRLPPNPAFVPKDETDPHKLFQLLRRKKQRNPNAMWQRADKQPVAPPPPPTSPPVQPVMAELNEVLRSVEPTASRAGPAPPTASAAPNDEHSDVPIKKDWTRIASSARPTTRQRPITREVHSAHTALESANDGRPCTRQKHPKKALDLFADCPAEPELFPSKPSRRSSTVASTTTANSKQPGEKGPMSPQEPCTRVDFKCLFFKEGDALEDSDEFPVPRAQVSIPLIETDWFTSDTWEELPVANTAEPAKEGSDTFMDEEGCNYAESLFEMLVAQKHGAKPSVPLTPQPSDVQ